VLKKEKRQAIACQKTSGGIAIHNDYYERLLYLRVTIKRPFAKTSEDASWALVRFFTSDVL